MHQDTFRLKQKIFFLTPRLQDDLSPEKNTEMDKKLASGGFFLYMYEIHLYEHLQKYLYRDNLLKENIGIESKCSFIYGKVIYCMEND